MTKKKRKPEEKVGRGRDGQAGRTRKPVVYQYQRNLTLGIGMIVFTLAWIALLAPLLSAPGSNKLLGYGLLAVISVVNWTIVLYALRVLPWAPKEMSLTRDQVVVLTRAGRERTVMRRIRGLRIQKNPILIFSRGLIIYGETSEGKAIRENVLFGDMGKDKVYELAAELKRYM